MGPINGSSTGGRRPGDAGTALHDRHALDGTSDSVLATAGIFFPAFAVMALSGTMAALVDPLTVPLALGAGRLLFLRDVNSARLVVAWAVVGFSAQGIDSH